MKINKYHIQVLVVEAWVLLLAALIAFGIVWGRTIRGRERAEAFLYEVTRLELGKSTFAEVQPLAQKYGGMPWFVNRDDMRCTLQRCQLRFIFENKPLTSVHLVRYAVLIAAISVQDGVVVRREVSYVRDVGRYNPINYEIVDDSRSEEHGARLMMQEGKLSRLNVDDKGIASSVWVGLGPTSSRDQRDRAYALDLSCLASLFDCNKPSAIFPPGIPYQGAPYQTTSDTW